MERKILHIDMDAFYASVEENRHDWEGPLVVCVYSGRTEDSGAVSTCNYDARELGIKAGIPIKRAKNMAEKSSKHVKFVGMDRRYYRSISEEIRDSILESYSDTIEQASIDEFYLDLSEKDNIKQIAKEIQERVNKEFDLTCSIGIGPNKLIAKIASDREKPDGLTIVKENEVIKFMNSLELEDIHGIGSKTVERLNELGIQTVEELRNAEPTMLIEEFGKKHGLKLVQKAKGEDDSPVEEQMQKQITRIVTLKENSRSSKIISHRFEELADDIFERVEKQNVRFGQVVLIVIDTNLQMYTRGQSLKTRVKRKDIIAETGENLLEEFMDGFDGEVRRVGLRLSDLKKDKGQTSFNDF